MSIHQTLFSAYPNPLIIVDSADFDGTNDVMTRGAALTGIADSKSGILSLWIRIDAQDGVERRVFSCATVQACQLNMLTSNIFELICQNSVPANVLRFISSTAYTASATWLHVLASWDLAVVGSGRLYINDVSDKTETTYADDTINYEGATNWSIGASTAGAADFDGCLAEVYFAPGKYLDFDLVYNRRKFISVSGKPVHFGATGALPTGTAPIVYQSVADGAAVATFATNLGTGGNYSITGTLETGSTSPSD
jgi:hypothetical protein